jgi:SAM-dependent methyltransferase
MQNNLKFSDVFEFHQGNSADKWQGYLKIYDEELSLIKNNCKKFLEIGINNGGSLEVFAKYFFDADDIVGIDIDQNCSKIDFEDSRIHAEIGNATELTTKQTLLEKYGKFDIILDDGSHQSSDIIKSFFNLFDLLEPGGTYIIEDLCCSYWKQFGGGLKSKTSAMHFLKSLSDVINFEHWRSDFTIGEYLKELGYEDVSRTTLEKISKIKSISFYNSICIIRTVSSSFENSIGKRFCRGNIFTLGSVPTNGQDIKDVGPIQNDNPYNIKILDN